MSFRRQPPFPYMTHAVHGPASPRPVPFGRRVTVQPWERAVLLRDGAVVGELGPGSHRRWQRRCEVAVVDVRPRLLEVPTQEVPTADGVPVKVTATARVVVRGPLAYVTAAQRPEDEVYLAVQVALREVVSTTSVESLVDARAALPAALLAAVRVPEGLGVEVEHVELKDLVLPADLRRAQAQVLVARAQAKADLERARGETAALRTLANAARLAAEQPTLLQLRLLQELGSSSGNSVVLGADAVSVNRTT